MEWIEQKSMSKFVVLENYKKEYEQERQLLIKKGDIFYGKILDIFDNPHFDGKAIRFEVCDENGKSQKIEATWSLSSYLVGDLGLNPDFIRERIAEVGDLVRIQYLGRDETREGKPYRYDVKFAKT